MFLEITGHNLPLICSGLRQKLEYSSSLCCDTYISSVMSTNEVYNPQLSSVQKAAC